MYLSTTYRKACSMKCLSRRVRLIVITCFAIALYTYDIVSDILLDIAYAREESHALEFGLTTAYIIVPAIICNFVCVYYIRLETTNHNVYRTIELVLTFPFLLGPLVRQFKILILELRKKDSKRVQTHAALVTLLEGYYESASQLILQFYLTITRHDGDEEFTTRFLRYASMLGSSAGLAWALVSVRRTNRLHDDDDTTDESTCGSVVFFLATLTAVGPRIVLMALFASQYTFYAFVLGGIHWFVCSGWIFLMDRTKDRFKPINVFLKCLLGYPLIFCFVDLDYVYTEKAREHVPTRYKMAIYYLIFYIENWTMLGLWLRKTEHKSSWFLPTVIAGAAMLMILHFFFQAIYYKCCHPKSVEIPVLRQIEVKSCIYAEPDDVQDEMIESSTES